MRSRRNKSGIVDCLTALLAMLLSVLVPVGCSHDDTGFVLANGSVFVMELAGSPRSEGIGNDLFWLGVRLWRPPMQGGVPSLAGSSYFVIPWILIALAFGGLLRVLWRSSGSQTCASLSCRQCGYNLTGNESGLCPECGTATEREVLGDS